MRVEHCLCWSEHYDMRDTSVIRRSEGTRANGILHRETIGAGRGECGSGVRAGAREVDWPY